MEVTNEVLNEKLDGLKELFNEKFSNNSREHKAISTRQDTANHRVNKLEDWKESHTHDIEEEMKDKFASKGVEKIAYVILTTVIISVVGGIMTMVLR